MNRIPVAAALTAAAIFAAAVPSAADAAAKIITCNRFGCSDRVPVSPGADSGHALKRAGVARHSHHVRKIAVRPSLPRFAGVAMARIGGAVLATIDCAGVPVRVAAAAGPRFEAFCRDMAAAGYPARPGWTSGYRPRGSCRGCDMHPRGLAIDFDQRARDRVVVAMPRRAVSAIAARHGLISGGDWCHGDLGHFEVDTGRNARPCSARRRSYAVLSRPNARSASRSPTVKVTGPDALIAASSNLN